MCFVIAVAESPRGFGGIRNNYFGGGKQMSFDLLAPVYRWMEIICAGEKMHHCRMAFLDEIPQPKKILLLGEGHGRALAECRRRFADAQTTCVDASEKMLIQARRQLQLENLDASRVEFIHADILNWSPPAQTYDLIITNYFLDCFRPEQLTQIIPKIAASAASNANWLLADFQLPATGFKRIRGWLILRLLYIFFSPHNSIISESNNEARFIFGKCRFYFAPPPGNRMGFVARRVVAFFKKNRTLQSHVNFDGLISIKCAATAM